MEEKQEDATSEEKVVSAEIHSEQSVLPVRSQKTKKHIEMLLIFVLGILIGFAAKTEASRRVTVGFGDYALKSQSHNVYDLNVLQKRVAENGGSSGIAAPQAAGGSCGQ